MVNQGYADSNCALRVWSSLGATGGLLSRRENPSIIWVDLIYVLGRNEFVLREYRRGRGLLLKDFYREFDDLRAVGFRKVGNGTEEPG